MRIFSLLLTCGLAGCLNSGAAPTAALSASTATAKVGQVVQLDGSKSVDKNKTGLTYAWRFVSTPPGSSPAFSDAASPAPTFTPDVEGAFVIGLVVKSGEVASSSAQTTVTAAGACFTIPSTATGLQGAKLDLVQVDPDPACAAAQASFRWELLSAPATSMATIQATGIDPHFVPDAQGTYQLAYAVAYGSSYRAPQPITVQVNACAAPVAIVTDNEPTAMFSVGEAINLHAVANVVSACAQEVATAQWEIVSVPPGADPTTLFFDNGTFGLGTIENGHNLTNVLAADSPGAYVVGLSVTDTSGRITHQEKTLAVLPVVDQNPNVTSEFGFALDGSDTPLVAYADSGANAVYLATLDASHFVWNAQLVFQDTNAAPAEPTHPAVAMMNGQPCVVFAHDNTTDAPVGLSLSCSNGTTFSSPTVIDASATADIPVVVSTNNGNGLIVFYSNGSAYQIATCASATSCSHTPYSLTTLDELGATMVTSNDVPRVVRFDRSAAPYQLKIDVCTTTACTTTQTAAVSEVLSAAPQFAVAAGATDNATRVLYVNDAGYLKFTTCTTSATTTTCSPVETVDQSSSFLLPAMQVLSAGASSGEVSAIWFNGESSDLIKATRDASGVWTKTPQGLFATAYLYAISSLPSTLTLRQTRAGNLVASLFVTSGTATPEASGIRIWQRPQ